LGCKEPCNPGWEEFGERCQDIDECAYLLSPCDSNANCTNTEGSYLCECTAGWEGDGDICEDTDECASLPNPCHPNATCDNTIGSYLCACNLGWEGDGDTCLDIDECATELSPCILNAACENSPGSYLCECGPGWEADGLFDPALHGPKACADIDECTSELSPCDPNAACANNPGSFLCQCNSGWQGDGQVCEPSCGDGICSNGDTCQTCGDDCATAGSGPDTTPLDAQEQAFLGIINNYRAQNGLGKLTACRSLNRAAQGHSEDMRDNNFFSHGGLNGSSPWDRACWACYELGCGPKTAMAENIAAGNSNAQTTFTQWKNSPGHNANMLKGNIKYIGIGRATGGGPFGVYWTNIFGGKWEPSCD
jgi:uncharacterized protein YkwD